jgi:hypothetical protein
LPGYVLRSAVAIVRSFATYRPLRFFVGVGGVALFVGLCLGLRYLYLVTIGQGSGHIQSVILAALLTGMGVLVALIGIVADLIACNRRLLEKVLAHQQASSESVPSRESHERTKVSAA